MYLRAKTKPGSPSTSVQLVEAYRDGDRIRQRLVCHIGSAADDKGIARLWEEGELVKAKVQDSLRQGLFPPETMARMAIESRRRKAQERGSGESSDGSAEEAQLVVTGFHEIVGPVYREIGLDRVLPPDLYRVSSDILFHMVIARFACPVSKRDSVRYLEDDLGVSLPLAKVYRMMDCLDDRRIRQMRSIVGNVSLAALRDSVSAVLVDCMTLAFETEKEDELCQKGFSKDGKHGESQELLALAVSREGHRADSRQPGQSQEGRSFAPLSMAAT